MVFCVRSLQARGYLLRSCDAPLEPTCVRPRHLDRSQLHGTGLATLDSLSLIRVLAVFVCTAVVHMTRKCRLRRRKPCLISSCLTCFLVWIEYLGRPGPPPWHLSTQTYSNTISTTLLVSVLCLYVHGVGRKTRRGSARSSRAKHWALNEGAKHREVIPALR